MKTVVLGDENVGKRSLINRLFYPRYSKKTITIDSHWAGSGFTTALYERQIGSRVIKFQIWILNPSVSKKKIEGSFYGKYKRKTIREAYCTGALGAIVVFDVTNKRSFNNVQRWIKQVWEHNGRGVIPLTIVATKIDLRENVIDSITTKKGKLLTEKFTKQLLPLGCKTNYREASINDKTLNVGEIFQELGQSYIDFITLKQKKN